MPEKKMRDLLTDVNADYSVVLSSMDWVIRFIDTLYTALGITRLRCYPHTSVLRSIAVSTSRFLVTGMNTGAITVSLSSTLQISRYCSTHKALN
jgi:hypothetical protein